MNLPITTDYLIVGAGLFGCTMAERLANGMGKTVTLIDKRNHIGGNCYSEEDPFTGIEVHKYGPHIFHTSNKVVWQYISQFVDLNSYRHTVIAVHQDKRYFLPINLATINALFNTTFDPKQAELVIAQQAKDTGCTNPQNFEEKALSMIGRPLYEAFIKGYTTKQWGTNPVNLPPSIIERLPVRFNYNVNYFNDIWQGVPLEGYTNMFIRMTNHPKITLNLGVDYFNIAHLVSSTCRIIYTGPIDRFFNYQHGLLGWRKMSFETYYLKERDKQGAYVVNYVDENVPYTRVLEFRHAHPELEKNYPQNLTIFTEEYPSLAAPGEDPYYPIKSEEDMVKLEKYAGLYLSGDYEKVTFGGRLGTYSYLDMGDCIKSALDLYNRLSTGKRI